MNDSVRVRVRERDREVEVEGSPEYVEQQLQRWLPRGEPANRVGDGDGGQRDGATGAEDGIARRVKEFVEAKKPNGHLELAAALVTWAKFKENRDTVTGAELEDLYKRAEQKRPADATNVMAKAASQKGWFKNIGGGSYQLTSAGEDHVRYDLGG